MHPDRPLLNQWLLYGLIAISAMTWYALGYHTSRTSTGQLFLLFGILFSLYLIVYNYYGTANFRNLVAAGILFRLILLVSIPQLSDDVYRFIWDGRLAANDISPFQYLPSELVQMQHPANLTKALYEQLNSPHYYAVYPPMMQWIFRVSGLFFPNDIMGAIIFFRSIILLFEVGTLWLLTRMLGRLSMPPHLSLLYFLNPLIIAELTGNLHFEAVMIFFICLSLYLLLKQRWIFSALGLGLAIATKLVPIIFIPVFIQKLGWRRGVVFTGIAIGVTIILFSLVMSLNDMQNLWNSISLFINKFEFNASLYYFIRWLGNMITGYNIIHVAGPLLQFMATVLILFISFGKKINTIESVLTALFLVLCTWFLFATTVHPWYISTVVMLGVFTRYRFAVVWSATALLSYAAYHDFPVTEKLWLIAAGYIFLFGFAAWEWKMKNKYGSYADMG